MTKNRPHMSYTDSISKLSQARIKNFFESVQELLEPMCNTHFNSRCLLGTTNTVKVIEFICLCMEEPPLTKEEITHCLNEIEQSFPIITNNFNIRGQ